MTYHYAIVHLMTYHYALIHWMTYHYVIEHCMTYCYIIAHYKWGVIKHCHLIYKYVEGQNCDLRDNFRGGMCLFCFNGSYSTAQCRTYHYVITLYETPVCYKTLYDTHQYAIEHYMS